MLFHTLEPAKSKVFQGADINSETLDLSNRSLTNNDLANFPSFPCLKNVNFSNNQLSWLPDELFSIKTIESIDISNNLFSVIPPCLGSLPKLKHLDIRGNRSVSNVKIRSLMIDPTKLADFYRSLYEHPPPPPKRAFSPVFTPNERQFTVLSYNILFQRGIRPNWYPFTPPETTEFHTRMKLLIEELEDLKADVVCLQEVDGNSYEGYLKPYFSSHGYFHTFVPKGRIRKEIESRKPTVHGQALFVNQSMFDVIDTHSFEHRHTTLGSMHPELKNFDGVGVASLLRHKVTNSFVVVGNTHLYYDYRCDDIRIYELESMVHEMRCFGEQASHFDLILAGDLNCELESVPLTELHKIEPEFVDSYRHLGHQKCFTTYTFDYSGEIDHVFSTQRCLKPISSLSLSQKEYLRSHFYSLPNWEFPSDHLPIVTVFEFNE